jgi:hypothetical protein
MSDVAAAKMKRAEIYYCPRFAGNRRSRSEKAAKWVHAAATLLLILLYYLEAKKAAKMLTIASMEPMLPGER